MLQLSPWFTEHMVLQRDQPMHISGRTVPGRQVRAAFMANTATAVADGQGNFVVSLPPVPAQTAPQALTVTDGAQTLQIEDCLVGDVWWVGGQSNADYRFNSNPQLLERSAAFLQTACAAQHIRLFRQDARTVQEQIQQTGAGFLLRPHTACLDPEISRWTVADAPEKIEDFSALGYAFARRLSAEFGAEIPLGMVMFGYGAATLAQLMPEPLYTKLGYTTWQIDGGAEGVPNGGVYHVFVAPLRGMDFCGMLFYQGESNRLNPATYADELVAYVAYMRDALGFAFPFYNIQLSGHGYQGALYWPAVLDVRNQQYAAAFRIADSVLIPSHDLGTHFSDMDWPHPNEKLALGNRAAEAVLRRHYGCSQYALAPLAVRADFGEERIVVQFETDGAALCNTFGEMISGFEVRDSRTGQFITVKGWLSGSDRVELPVCGGCDAVRYGYTHHAYTYECSLFSNRALPATAFLIEKTAPTPVIK